MSKGKKKQNNNLKFSVLVILVLIILIIIYAMTVLLNQNDEIEEVAESNTINIVINDENITENENTAELELLQSMTERNRIEYYVTKFIKYVEYKDYSTAYDMLNDEYKENYFPTLSEFESYAGEMFTTMMNVDYTNFERNGEIYVIWLTLTDAINGDPNDGTEMTFVVKESDYNDIELSFSVV